MGSSSSIPTTNGCYEWPWSGNGSSGGELCDSVEDFTRNGVQNWFGDFYGLVTLGTEVFLVWYLFLCFLKCCGGVILCKDCLGCCCARYNGHLCQPTALSPPWEAAAVVLCAIKVGFIFVLYYPPFWNGTAYCGFWSWDLLNLILMMVRSLFFICLAMWMNAELRKTITARRPKGENGLASSRRPVTVARAVGRTTLGGSFRGPDNSSLTSETSSVSVYSTALLGSRKGVDYHAIVEQTADDSAVMHRRDQLVLEDKGAWAALVAVGIFVVFILEGGVATIGSMHPPCHDDLSHVHTTFSFNNPCQFIGVSQLVLKCVLALFLFSLGRRCELDHLPQHLSSLARTIMVFGLAEFGWVIAYAIFFGLDLVWTFEFEVALHLVLVTAPVLQFLARTLFKCSNPAVVVRRSHGMERRGCRYNRHRTRQCCQSLQYTVPLIVIVSCFSAALAAITGIATCPADVFNRTLAPPGNYTPLQNKFGVGIFYARAGAGPLGFLIFVTSVCVYFGVMAGMEKGLSGLPVPRVTGSPVAAHSLLAIVLLAFLAVHIGGHWAAKVAFDDMTVEERATVGHRFFVFFDSFVDNWPLPYSYLSGAIATFGLLVLTLGGIMSVSDGGIFPWCCCKRFTCKCCKCCGIYEAAFRSVHRVTALLVPPLLFFHSVEQSLGDWLIWTWMLLLLLFAGAEYIGFQGWCTWKPCCLACRPESLKICSMRQQATILSVKHELQRVDGGWVAKPNVLILFRCNNPGFAPKVGEFCFLGVADKHSSVAKQIFVGNSFHPFTVFSAAEDNVYGFYLHTGLDPDSQKCREERGGWCFTHFGEAVAGRRFPSPEDCYETALNAMAGKPVFVVGGFPSELARPSFLRANKIFCTCAGAGATPFIALAGDVFKHPDRYQKKTITVVRAGKHAALPEFLEQFGLKEVDLDHARSDVERGSVGDEKLSVVATMSAAVGGLKCMQMDPKLGFNFYYIQGYVNVASVLEAACALQEQAVREILRSRHPGGAHGFAQWERSLPRPLLQLDEDELRSLMDGWPILDILGLLDQMKKAQQTTWKNRMRQIALHYDVEPIALEGVDSNRRVEDALRVVLGHKGDINAEKLVWDIRDAQEAVVLEVLKAACNNGADDFHPWKGLRPLLGISDESQLSDAFGEDSFAIIEDIVDARRSVVQRIFSTVYDGPLDFGTWYEVLALGEFPNVYKLDESARDRLCPIVKLAGAFASVHKGSGESVSYGHCGHGDRIDYDSNAFQMKRSAGEAFVETFD